MKVSLFFFVAVILSTSFAQTKRLIYFTDKGITANESLDKSSDLYQSALSELTEKCINRRIKTLGEENIISFEDIPIKPYYISSLESLGIKIENNLKWFNAVSAYLTEQQFEEILLLNFIDRIEKVRILKFNNKLPEVTDPLSKQFHLDFPINYGESFDQLQLSDIPIVHSKGITGESVRIGMLDTGFDWKNHESLQNATILAEYDFVNKDPITSDEENDQPGQHNHGTLTFSVVGGFKDSSLIGSAFGSAFVLAKTEDIRSETHVEEDNYAAALQWMENFGVDITSSSLGYSQFDASTFSYTYEDMDGKTTIVTRAAETAFRKGVLTVSSAGNEAQTPWFYIIAPSDGFNTIGVGAVNSSNEVAGFSSRGPTFDGRVKPDVVTRGVSVYGARASTFSDYLRANGTSLSAPIASGIASLLLSAYPHLKNTQLRNILFETAGNTTTPNNERGYGLLSALRAVEFPNLKSTQGTFTINKMFIEKENVLGNQVSINLLTNGQIFEPQEMEFDGEKTYTFKLPYFFNGDVIQFYFTYSDSSNNSFREPVQNNYEIIYGQLEVSLNIPLERRFTDFIVSDIYPNPFLPFTHNFTRVSLNSRGNEKLRITILDATGQQVKLLETETIDGENHFDWDGVSDRGLPCASGVYYYLIRKGENDYGRKMILLR
ncbi:MAG: S8 family serine peptidase [Ignavibacteriaceae bacterium]